jgi:hypothetical protein
VTETGSEFRKELIKKEISDSLANIATILFTSSYLL